ncbi:MAG: diguanylate cyclase, partial [Emcibacteraceae bacterium]|nr:diguanylate cyclase [Emcibacteraceae bacterium]
MSNNPADIDKKSQILPDQLKILFANIIPNTFGSVLIMIIYLWSFNSSFESNIQYYWAGGMIIALAGRLCIYKLSRKEKFYDKSKKWLLIYTAVTFLIGLTWGLVTLIPINYGGSELLSLTIITMLLAISCIQAISSSSHTYIIWAFLTPIAIFSSIFLIKSTSAEYGAVMGIGALVFCIVAGFIGQGLHKMVVGALYMQYRNSSLMDEVVHIAKQNQRSYEGFQLLLDNLGAGAAMFDKQQNIMSWNKSFESIFNLPNGLIKRGMGLKEIIRKIIKQSWQNNIDVEHAADIHIKEILTDKETDALVKLILADGRNLYSKVMKLSDDQMVLNYTDVTSLEKARTDDIIHVLQHDSLTGLPNQVLHKKEVRKRIVDFRRAAASNESNKDDQFMALICLGLSSLNEIYEFLGLNAGDQVVTEIAKRLEETLTQDVHLSHVGYDEFHIITSNEKTIEGVQRLVEDLNKILGAPIQIGDSSITVTTTVGISTYPEHADKTDVLSRNAKIAHNKAKLPNGDSIVVYNHGMHSEIMERSNMLFDIRDSMSKSQFLLHYQPQ